MLYEKLEYILAIAEEQNLTRAARRLYISQPTLTMYLNRLEAELGVTLFDRRKNPIQLTNAGRFYIEKMKEVAEAEQALREELPRIANPVEVFRIGAGRVRGHFWLPPLLGRFLDIYPNMNVSVFQGSERDMQKMLIKNMLDVAVGAFHEMPESEIPLVTEELCLERMLLVSSRRFRLVPEEMRGQNSPDNPYVLEPRRLQHLPFILPPGSNGMSRSFQRLLGTYQIRPSRTVTVDMMNTGLAMAAAGLGVQLISAGILIGLPAEARENLDFCTLADFPRERICMVSWRRDTDKEIMVREAVGMLRKEVLPEMPYTWVVPEEQKA